jgi:predicted nucleic-acid-binding protein
MTVRAASNVLLRLMTADDAAQTRAAREIVLSQGILVTNEALLESVWVLTSVYGLNRERACDTLDTFFSGEGIRIEAEEPVARALSLYRSGWDFADALQVAMVPSGGRFASFDRDLIRRGKRARPDVNFIQPTART